MISPSITTVPPKAPGAPPYYEAYWRHPVPGQKAKPVKRRLGKAWVTATDDGWVKRKGRAPEGWLDLAHAHVKAGEAVKAYQAELDRKLAAQSDMPPLRQVAHEWMSWKRDVKGNKPSTLEHDAYLLLEPGTPHRRGSGKSAGEIMARWGDVPVDLIDPRGVSEWLRTLDKTLSPRGVNERRKILHAILTYAGRADTYALPSNPVAGTDKRRENPQADLDFYEVAEVEQLAAVCLQGLHRETPNYKGRPVKLSGHVKEWRDYENLQDATFFMTLLYSGMRLGEARALRWSSVDLSLEGGVLTVKVAVSGEEEGETKGRRARMVPVPADAARRLATLQQRPHFVGPDDYVFINRDGGRLDPSALRRRYKKACEAAGIRQLRIHDFRHAAGSHVARAGSNTFVRDFLGHSKLAMTDRYLHAKVAREGIAVVNRAFGPSEVSATPADVPAETEMS